MHPQHPARPLESEKYTPQGQGSRGAAPGDLAVEEKRAELEEARRLPRSQGAISIERDGNGRIVRVARQEVFEAEQALARTEALRGKIRNRPEAGRRGPAGV